MYTAKYVQHKHTHAHTQYRFIWDPDQFRGRDTARLPSEMTLGIRLA